MLINNNSDDFSLPGILIEFFKVNPGSLTEEKLCSDTDNNSLTFDHFGEWDHNRISLVFNLNDDKRLIKAIPEINADLTNHMSFLAYPISGKEPNSWIEPSAHSSGVSWSLGKDFRNGITPLCTMICIRMHPDGLKTHGTDLERIFAEWVTETAASNCFGPQNENVSVWVLGTFGWKQIIVLVATKTFVAANEFVKYIISQPFISTDKNHKQKAINYTARSISYPLIYHESYAAENLLDSEWGKQADGFTAKFLISRRPGIPIPQSLNPKVFEKNPRTSSIDSFKERFGEYDGEYRFQENTTLGNIIKTMHFIRQTNSESPSAGWLASTTVFLEFPYKFPEKQMNYYTEPPAKSTINVKALIQQNPDNPLLRNDRFLALLQRIANLGKDPQLRPTIAPLERFCTQFIEELLNKNQPPGQTVQISSSNLNAIHTALEHALAQRTDGINQFIHTALSAAYHSHGSINRLISVFDAILCECGNVANYTYTGFTVFGLSTYDRYMHLGPIVCVPPNVMYSINDSWTIYHEAFNHIYDVIFSPILPYLTPRHPTIFEKILPDLITFVYPFKFKVTLMCKAYALRFFTQGVSSRKTLKQSENLLVRLGTVSTIRYLARKHIKEQLQTLQTRDEFDNYFKDLLSQLMSPLNSFEDSIKAILSDSEIEAELSRMFSIFFPTITQPINKNTSTHILEEIKRKIVENLESLLELLRTIHAFKNRHNTFNLLNSLCYALFVRYRSVQDQNNGHSEPQEMLIADIIFKSIERKLNHSEEGGNTDNSVRMCEFYSDFTDILDIAANRSYLPFGG